MTFKKTRDTNTNDKQDNTKLKKKLLLKSKQNKTITKKKKQLHLFSLLVQLGSVNLGSISAFFYALAFISIKYSR